MKDLDLDKTWELCLEMWKDITTLEEYTSEKDMWERKDQWLKDHGFSGILHSCFFCNYSITEDSLCGNCPGQLVDSNFHCEEGRNSENFWHDEPEEFYQELVRLSNIKESKKK